MTDQVQEHPFADVRPRDDRVRRAIALRRIKAFAWIALIIFIDLFATGWLGGSGRALAIARTVVLPGLAFLEWNLMIAVVTMLAALAALYCWFQWGLDWVFIAILALSLLVATFIMPVHEHPENDAVHDHSTHDHAHHHHGH